MSDEEILSIIPWEEQKMIDRMLFHRMVSKVDVAVGSDIQISSIVNESKVKFPGRAAQTFMFGGGFEAGLQQMNLTAVNAKLQYNEMVAGHQTKLAKLEKNSELQDPTPQVISKFIAKFKTEREVLQDEHGDPFHPLSVENVCSDVISSLEALQQHDIDISAIRDDIIKASYDAVLLYTGNSGIEIDPVCAAIENIIIKLQALMLPIVFPVHITAEGMLKELDGHNQHAQE